MKATSATSADPAIAPPGRRRVLLVDDHAILRMGLRSLLELEPDLQIVAEAGGTDEALALIPDARPDIVVTDVAMPGRNGLELVDELRARWPEIRVLVLTAHNDEEYIRAALSRGVYGFVLKDSSRHELLGGVRAVLRGEHFLCEAVTGQVVSRFRTGWEEAPVQPTHALVTRREHEVLTRIASGHTSRRIADDLGLSVKTVRKHRQNLMQKLSLHNAAAITAYAYSNGLVAKQSAG